MFAEYFKSLAILVIVLFGVICFSADAIMAEDVGDQYYPTASEDIASKEQLEQAHKERIHKSEDEYKKKIAALEKLYDDKNNLEIERERKIDENTQKIEQNRKNIDENRKNAATLKEERMKKRAELDEAFMKRRLELQDIQEIRDTNQYAINARERKKYFENKNKKEAPQDLGE